jgi:DNA polymerase IV
MENSQMRTILHLDMNSYFATAEQQANPYLRGRPVGIIKAAGRGCVIAASVEAKKYGVKTGCTVWDARRLCPEIVLVPSDMDKYFAITNGLIKIANHYSPSVEIFSIDEMFLDITQVQDLYPGGALEIALSIKQDIKQGLGEWMKASIGISFTKLLAKLASEINKPDGLTFLTPENCLIATENINVEEVCGIGYARTAYLHRQNIYTLGQARAAELPKEISDLVWFRINEPLTRISDLEPAKSVSRTFTTFRQLDSTSDIKHLTRNLVEEATAKMREMNMVGRTFCLSIDSFWARRTVSSPVNHGSIIFEILWKEYLKNPIIGIRHAGVSISNLSFNIQNSIFYIQDNALSAMDQMNEKYGLFTVYPGSLLNGELIRPEVTGYLGDKWYRFGR